LEIDSETLKYAMTNARWILNANEMAGRWSFKPNNIVERK